MHRHRLSRQPPQAHSGVHERSPPSAARSGRSLTAAAYLVTLASRAHDVDARAADTASSLVGPAAPAAPAPSAADPAFGRGFLGRPGSGPASILASLQRQAGNRAVAGLVERSAAPTIQRDPPAPAAATADADNSGPTVDNLARAVASDSFGRAQRLIEAAPDDHLSDLRRQVSLAMRATTNPLTLELGGETFPGFDAARLPALLRATDPAARAARRQRDAQEAARRQEEAERAEALRRRTLTLMFLVSIDLPHAAQAADGTRVWQVRDPAGGVAHVTEPQLVEIRARVAAEVQTLLDNERNWAITATESRARSWGGNQQYDDLAAAAAGSREVALRELGRGRTGLLSMAFEMASQALVDARSSQEAASAQATDTTAVEHIITGLRFVRDAAIVIDGALLTVVPGGGVVVGAVVSGVAGGVATAEDQWSEGRRVQVRDIIVQTIISTLIGIALGRVSHGATQAIELALTRRVEGLLADAVIRRAIMSRLTQLLSGQLQATATAALTGLVRGQSAAQIREAVLDANTVRAWVLAIIGGEAGVRGEAMRQREQAAAQANAADGPRAGQTGQGGQPTTAGSAARAVEPTGAAAATQAPPGGEPASSPGIGANVRATPISTRAGSEGGAASTSSSSDVGSVGGTEVVAGGASHNVEHPAGGTPRESEGQGSGPASGASESDAAGQRAGSRNQTRTHHVAGEGSPTGSGRPGDARAPDVATPTSTDGIPLAVDQRAPADGPHGAQGVSASILAADPRTSLLRYWVEAGIGRAACAGSRRR